MGGTSRLNEREVTGRRGKEKKKENLRVDPSEEAEVPEADVTQRDRPNSVV